MSWLVGVSTGACTLRPILDVLDALAPIGVTGVELGTPPRHFDPWQNGQVLAVKERLGSSTLRAISIHAPFGGLLDLSDPNAHHRHAAIGAIMAAARALKQLGGRIIVVHPTDVVRHGADVDGRLHACADSLHSLSEICRQEDMTLAIESPLPHLIGGHPDEFAWLLRHVDGSAGVCLDTGHTALGHHWRRFVDVAGSRLVHVHASDNHGQYDDHLPPGEGRLEWSAIAQSLRDAAFAGWIMLELRCPEGDLGTYFQHARAQALRLLDP
jgi:sugar phosphate isomerase/epimerase